MKKRRFAAGGETFSAAQLEWLGGADRTDPYILARMRRAVPDTPHRAPVEDRRPDWVRPEPKAAERTATTAADETPKRAEPKVSAPAPAADETPKRAEPKVSAPAEERQERPAPNVSTPRARAAAESVSDSRPRGTEGYGVPQRAEPAAKPSMGGSTTSTTAEGMRGYKPRRENVEQPLTREQLFAKIPTGGSGEGPTPSAGNSADSTEFGRRLNNVAMALPGMGAIRVAQTAVSAATAGKAARTAAEAAKNRERVLNPLYWMAGSKNASKFDGSAAAAKVAAKPAAKPAAKMTKADKEKAKLAGELRSAHNPTKFSSRSKKQDAKNTRFKEDEEGIEFKRGGAVKRYANGGSVSSRADGIAARGRTRGKMC